MKSDQANECRPAGENSTKKDYEKPQLFIYESLQNLTGGRPSKLE